ncbi:hypothetical protein IFM89_025782 [Coptis chinensis]|uniref:Uncharacterized protein n=1 Tax=Coptis chinensis TaxID=261450 RepID=A0A835LKF6_9MAGN|nr:hypothetical protein IFM89_025782 [Coptis chinensis]
MGLPWYRVHTVVLNDPGRLLAVHIMHTDSRFWLGGSMALYELAVFDPSTTSLIQCGDKNGLDVVASSFVMIKAGKSIGPPQVVHVRRRRFAVSGRASSVELGLRSYSNALPGYRRFDRFKQFKNMAKMATLVTEGRQAFISLFATFNPIALVIQSRDIFKMEQKAVEVNSDADTSMGPWNQHQKVISKAPWPYIKSSLVASFECRNLNRKIRIGDLRDFFNEEAQPQSFPIIFSESANVSHFVGENFAHETITSELLLECRLDDLYTGVLLHRK